MLEKFKLFDEKKIGKYENEEVSPLFFRISNSFDRRRLEELLDAYPYITIHDTIRLQLYDLIRCRNPHFLSGTKETEDAFHAFLGTINVEEYGVWVYYPWSNKLVHLLDEEEFVLVRTNRNQYKITQEEKELLATKKVGVIGLSVGQSVSVALAMERSFGELRIADFDTLDITNLNRIRTGVANIGCSKVVIVAREIAEIDPFLKVSCFKEGITEENIERFFLEGGKLDALIEECDGLYIKVLSRIVAKKHHIPVIMDTSDRGMIDIERFDKDPTRPIFHGYIEHLDLAKLKAAKTNEEKVPFVMAIIGAETMSKRMKSTLPEVEQSVTTWPQLATSVIMGGAFAADIYRRLMLGSDLESGRYFIDTEELIRPASDAERVREAANFVKDYTESFGSPLTRANLDNLAKEYVDPILAPAVLLDKNTLVRLIHSATLAPSGGNCQPWKWLYKENGMLLLFHDAFYSKSLLDFDDSGSNIAFGAALQNLTLEAEASGLSPVYTLFPLGDKHPLVAAITFTPLLQHSPYSTLRDQIPFRCTNRTIGTRKEIDPDVLLQCGEAVKTIPGASLRFLDAAHDLKTLSEIVGAADRIRMLNPYGHYDLFYREMRWNPEEASATGDGIDIDTLDMTLAERAGMFVAKDWEALRFLSEWRLGKAFEKISKKTVLASSAIGILSMPSDSAHDYVNAGKALQKIWLTATKHTISFQPQAPILFLFSRLLKGHGHLLSESEKTELFILKEKFDTLLAVPENQKGIFLFRLCVCDDPKVRSLRRPLEDVLLGEYNAEN